MAIWEPIIHENFLTVLVRNTHHLKSERAGNALLIPLLVLLLYHYSCSENSASIARHLITVVRCLLATILDNISGILADSNESTSGTVLFWSGAPDQFVSKDVIVMYSGQSSVSGNAWSSSSASQPAEQLKLAEAFVCWNRLARRQEKALCQGTDEWEMFQAIDIVPESKDISRMLDRIMDTNAAYFELNFCHPDGPRREIHRWHHRRVILHVSHRLGFALERYNMCLPMATIHHLHADLRVICLPIPVMGISGSNSRNSANGETRNLIHFTPSEGVSIQLLSNFQELTQLSIDNGNGGLLVFPKRPALLLERTNILMTDIAIAQPQLNPVQQVLALGCVRTRLPRLLDIDRQSVDQ